MRFEELFQFMSAYFNEDWDFEADSAEGVVSIFLSTSPSAEKRQKIAAQIDDFEGVYRNDEELESALCDVLGCYYLPSGDNLNPRTWILSVRDRLLASQPR